MAVTSVGVTAQGLAVPALWVASQQPAVLAGAHSAGPPLHASLASGALPGAGATGSPLQSIVQSPQPGVALWSTIAPIVSQIGGPPPSVGVANSADAARAAMFLSQLAALQPPAQTAAQHSLFPSSPAYVASPAEGAPQKASPYGQGQRRP